MRLLHGTPASGGTAVGPAYVHLPDAIELPEGPAEDPARERAALGAALDAVAEDLAAAASLADGDVREILRAQAMMARDPALRTTAEQAVQAGMPAARALVNAGEGFAADLEATTNAYLVVRGADVRHICDLASRALVGAPPRQTPRPTEPSVIVAADLMPAEVAQMDTSRVLGIATLGGSPTSHTVIVARGLGIPAVVGVRGLLDATQMGTLVGLDGQSGLVHIEPDAQTVSHLHAIASARLTRHETARARAGSGPTATADGHPVAVAANIRGVEELRTALAEGAEAVGLLRTELLFIDRDRPPTVEEQVTLLREMRALLKSRRLVVRTFDIGSDKSVPFLPVRPERNPELGVRGLRLARAHPELLDAQLQAVVIAAAEGRTAVMAPMIATLEEAEWFVERVKKAGAGDDLEIGLMVEIPSAVLLAGELAAGVDFLSIGTNDLAQYLHAADRRQPELAALQSPFHPAMLRAVAMVCEHAGDRCWVGVCGEAASDPAWACLAVGLGVTELSMQGTAIAEVRATLRHVHHDDCRQAAARALVARDAATARSIACDLVTQTRKEAGLCD